VSVLVFSGHQSVHFFIFRTRDRSTLNARDRLAWRFVSATYVCLHIVLLLLVFCGEFSFIFALMCSLYFCGCFGLQWEELLAMVKLAERNNPLKAGTYPETREGLLALKELDLGNRKLTGLVLACVVH
jgi:hypothetical protein